MGVFDKLFSYWSKKALKEYFATLTGYAPVFTTYDGGVYEMELTRSCIHAFANHCSKLQPVVEGADLRKISALLNGKINSFQTSAQFLYKAATIYDTQNTCIIVPQLNEYDQIVGYYPVNPTTTEIVEDSAHTPYLRFSFSGTSEKAAIELDRCGIVAKYLYSSDFYGEDNRALKPTLQLLNMQNQGIAEGIKNSASFRFMATMSNLAKDADIKKERDRFVKENFGEGSGGLALFSNMFKDIKQIVSSPRVVDPEQMKIIQTRVFDYFGSNEDILQNKAVGDKWAGYYEGKVEPFAIQLSQAMTQMTYSQAERSRNNAIAWTSNRLQYMTNADKLQVSSQMFDRGVMSINDIMDIWNLPHVEDGDKRYIRKEYAEVSKLNEGNAETTEEQNDTEKQN